MPTNHNAAALPGHLNQCAITDARLHANPLGIQFNPLHPPCDLQLDDQTAITKNNFLVISYMPGVDHQGNTHSNQFQPYKRRHQGGSHEPKESGNPQGDHTQRRIKPPKLRWRKATIALQQPLHDLLAINALRGRCGESETGGWMLHGATR